MKITCSNQPSNFQITWLLFSTNMVLNGYDVSEYQKNLKNQREIFCSRSKEKQTSSVKLSLILVVKRIIKVWDRIMHKFKYKCELWKQYLNFCIVIESKKHFFKALAHAVRFLPFEL